MSHLIVVPRYEPARAEWLLMPPWRRFPTAFALLWAWGVA